jgi:transposase
MSTSLLYHAFAIREYKYVRTDYQGGNTIFTIERKAFTLRCPCCKGKNVIRHGAMSRWFCSLPIGRKTTYIKVHIPRVECVDCQITRQIDIGFADPRMTYTRYFKARYASMSPYCHPNKKRHSAKIS